MLGSDETDVRSSPTSAAVGRLHKIFTGGVVVISTPATRRLLRLAKPNRKQLLPVVAGVTFRHNHHSDSHVLALGPEPDPKNEQNIRGTGLACLLTRTPRDVLVTLKTIPVLPW